MNIEKLFPFFADIVFRAKCIACVSPVIIELNFGSDASSESSPSGRRCFDISFG